MSSDLFTPVETAFQPLAARMRPRSLDRYIGQGHILAPGKPLRDAIDQGQLHSMIFWGPPGVGKTTLARLLAQATDSHFDSLSAVMAGVKEIRQTVELARSRLAQGRRTVLFIDEVHRFNKAQQDAFLPYIEDGTVIFIGATTENPSFELNNALLSRARVYKLRALSQDELTDVLRGALAAPEGLAARHLNIDDATLQTLALAADGDARRALNLLEIAADLAPVVDGQALIDQDVIDELLISDVRRFDKGGDAFYDQISALHKAVRGTSPDAALYWFARMIDGGCDPLYIARRVIRMAVEDIGNADPRALQLALNAWDTQERLGSPEGELALAQAVTYMACAPKSNAVYTAYKAVMAEVRSSPSHEVPLHLRNAPTKLMKSLGHGAEYRYAHDYPGAYAAGENYMPEALADRRYYTPSSRGLEGKISAKLEHLRQLDEASDFKRYPAGGKP